MSLLRSWRYGWLGAALVLAASCGEKPAAGEREIAYQGATFKLTKRYENFEKYKDDPDNLDPSEVPRIERLMTEVKIGPDFNNWKDFSDQVFNIKFPGYGYGPGPAVTSESRRFRIGVLEIPKASKERWLVLEELDGGRLRLVDDFVLAAPEDVESAITIVNFRDDALAYFNAGGRVVRKTAVPPGSIHH